MRVLTEHGRVITEKWQGVDKEKKATFTPSEPWNTGAYKMRIERRLEDLAGNNLNRPFNRDVTRKVANLTAQPFVDLHFSVYA